MIYKIYGDTGAGKTSYTMFHVKQNIKGKEFYTNIEVKPCSDLKSHRFTTEEFTQFLLTIPADVVNSEEKFKEYLRDEGIYNRIYAFDEIQFILSQKETARRFYLLLTIQRHLNLDIYIITQALSVIPSNIKALGKDVKVIKNSLVGIVTKRAITFQTGEAGKLSGMKQRIIIPKGIYQCYHSHKSESKSHWKLLLYVFGAIFFFAFGIYRAFSATSLYQKNPTKTKTETRSKAVYAIQKKTSVLCEWVVVNVSNQSQKHINIHLIKVRRCKNIDVILEKNKNREDITEIKRIMYKAYKMNLISKDTNTSMNPLH